MEKYSIGFIGGGRVTKIILKAFENKKANFRSIYVADTNSDVLIDLKRQFPYINTTGDAGVAASRSIVFIALHPPVLMETIKSLNKKIKPGTVVVSLAPKITINMISSLLGNVEIVRMIPNATSFINEGFNPLCFGDGVSEGTKFDIFSILKILGNTFEVKESSLEAYAIVSAMLPTYFWFQWKEIEKLGLEMGLSADESKTAVRDTLIASIQLLYDSGLKPEEVIDLIPVKPIGESEEQIIEVYRTRLMGLYQKIKA